MADASALVNKVAWVDLSTTDVAAAGAFYSRLFGWQVDVSPDPQYGGYAIAQIDGGDVAGIGPLQSPGTPPNWMVYIGTTDAAGLGAKVQAAGGTVIAPAFDVGDQGRMAVFQDPAGAFISAWQPQDMGRFHAGGDNQFGWAELSSRGLDKAIPFYETVFGWTAKSSPMGEGGRLYTEFRIGERPHRWSHGHEPHGPAGDAQLLGRLLQRGRRRRRVSHCPGCRRPRDAPADRLPGRPLRVPQRPPGCGLRPVAPDAQVGVLAGGPAADVVGLGH